MPQFITAQCVDTFIKANHTTWNYGITNSLELSANGGGGFWARGLITSDVSSIPTNATVVSASLSVKTKSGSAAGVLIGAYNGLKAWIEGLKNGDVANAGEPTWSHRLYDTVAWNASGGTAGVDYAAVKDGEVEAAADATRYSITLAAATVQAWVDNAANNFGLWLIRTDTQAAMTIHSLQAAAEADRPTITVGYTVPLKSGLF